MNNYIINVNFEKKILYTDLQKLVKNDYNSTKINFTFDKEGRILFKMMYPDGNIYVTQIDNNELILTKGILNQDGRYEIEISLYTDDSRLTDYMTASFEVRKELVETDDLVEVDERLPILDTLIVEINGYKLYLNEVKKQVENGEFNGKDGRTPTIGENGNWFIGEVDTGKPSQGPAGPQGPAGGVTIEEVEAITGELKNLPTEDKTNIVNSIIELSNNSGGGNIPLYQLHTSNSHFSNDSATFNNKSGLAEIINDAYSKGYKKLLLNLTYGSETSSNENIFLDVFDKNLQNKPTNISFKTLCIGGSRFIPSSLFSFDTYQLAVNLSWNGDVCSVNSATMYRGSPTILATNNNAAFTPTGNYHPATKKYVDSKKTSWDNLENKPFGEVISENIIIPEISVPSDGEWYEYNYEPETFIPLVVGQEYTVIWNGTTYICEAYLVNTDPYGDTDGTIGLGNETWLSSYGYRHTDIPFGVGVLPSNNHYWIRGDLVSDIEAATIKVSISETTSKQIDSKYLPDTIATKEYVDNAIGTVLEGSY